MQHGRRPSKDFHPNDPRGLTREAVAEADIELAKVWALLALAEAIHRHAKVLDKDEHLDARHLRPVGFDPEAA